MRTLIKRYYPTFSGVILERYFREKAIENEKYTLIGSWWNRKGENEIDRVAANEFDKTVEIYEIKRNRMNIDFTVLEGKVKTMLTAVHLFDGYNIEAIGLDMQDI